MIWIWSTLAAGVALMFVGIMWALTGIAGKHNREQERYENDVH